jgi:L-amino acid N-acyltransferase YncA
MMGTSPLAATRVVGAVTILPAKPGDMPAILHLITSLDLPPEGIQEAMEYFWVAREGTDIVGTVGLEVYANLALLRSLAVVPGRQGSGLGRALMDTVLSYLTERQFRAVYLLTTTAESFFTRYDFRTISRSEVPAIVQQSIEFQAACPETATCMVRTLSYAATTSTPELRVRAARFADLQAIREIHNQGILDRIATLDTEPRTMQETHAWFYQHGPRHPVLVAETAGVIAGWATLNTFNSRTVYQYVADLSVYIERQRRGQGIGTTLLQAIIALGRELDYHKIVLSAFPFNTAGMQLYERHGFTTVGIYKEMGQLDGRWVDTIIMEKLLSTG